MSIVAGVASRVRARVSGRTVFADPVAFEAAVDFDGPADADAGAAGAVTVRFARLALPIGRCSSCRSRRAGRSRPAQSREHSRMRAGAAPAGDRDPGAMPKKNLPLTAVAAGLPQLPVLAGEAKSYAERLFEFRSIGQLSVEATRQAFVGADETVEWADDALDLLVDSTDRYPHFIQEWGRKVWEAASASPVQAGDVERARAHVMAALDTGFFKLRSDRATDREREYMATMARLGSGPCRSGEVARQMGGKGGASVGVFRDNLIRKGLIYAPDHGLVDFTVPHFGVYMRRNHLA
jgi:hypothetical protein